MGTVIEYPEVRYAESFEEAMWGLIRLWMDAARASIQLCGHCCPFVHVWSEVCVALGRGYLGRWPTNEESMWVWRALVDAQYPR